MKHMSPESPETKEIGRSEAEIKSTARGHIQKERGLMERLGANYKKHMRAAALMSVLAGASACTESDENDISDAQTRVTEGEARERIEVRRAHRHEKRAAEDAYNQAIEDRTKELAEKMHIEYKTATYLSDIVTSINGTPVPPELYTEKERTQLKFVRAMRDIERENSADPKTGEGSTGDPSKRLESRDVDTGVY